MDAESAVGSAIVSGAAAPSPNDKTVWFSSPAPANSLSPASPTSSNISIPGALGSTEESYLICDVNFPVDANKSYADTDDDLLCWAATTANMLYWGGWTATITIPNYTINSSQDLFSYFEYCFSDEGGHAYYGITWFLSGVYDMQGADGWSQLEQDGGDFYSGLTVSDYMFYTGTYTSVLPSIDTYLHDGYVCGLGITWEGGGGHAVTCWGYNYDSTQSTSSTAYYTGVWITDSDDYESVVRLCDITWDSSYGAYKILYDADSLTYGWLDDLTALKPYVTFTASVYSSISGESVSNGTQTVYNGGTTIGVTVGGGGVQVISSGGVASSTTLATGQQLVSSGGSAISATVSSGGSQTVYTGGLAISSFVSSGGVQVISSGGVASSASLISGGVQTVSSGGVASGTVISSGGSQGVSSGGVVSGTVVNFGASQTVYANGTGSGTTVGSGGVAMVYGRTVSDVLSSGGSQAVYSGGIASGTVVSAGASQTVYANGSASGTIARAGVELLYGTATGTVLSSGGSQAVFSGGTASGTIVSSGGSQALSGGKAVSATVSAGGLQTVLSGGVASSTTVSSGGLQTVSSSGVASAAVLSSGGSQTLLYGGSAYWTAINSGAFQVLSSGSLDYGATINANGTQTLYGGRTVSASIVGSGHQYVSSGGVASATSIGNGGVQDIYSGGSAVTATVSSGGVQCLHSASASLTTVSSGGVQLVSSGGVAGNATVLNGGSQHVLAGGSGVGASVSSGGSIMVGSGGSAFSFSMLAGGILGWDFNAFISGTSNGTAVSAVSSSYSFRYSILSGGVQGVSAGYLASSATVSSGATQNVLSGGSATSSLIVGGVQNVSSGGFANGGSIQSGMQTVLSGGVASGASVQGGAQNVSSGGVASRTVLTGSGVQNVSSGGHAIGAVVSSGGTQNVLSGGIADSTTVSGGLMTVFGTANSAVISSGGVQSVSSGGSAVVASIHSGGTQNVLSGGSASGATIYAGGSQSVSSGGVLSGELNFAGGSSTVANASSLNSSGSFDFSLANAVQNDAILTINSGSLQANDTYSLDITNAVSGSYILMDAAELSSLAGCEFSVTHYSSTVSLDVGSTSLLSDGSALTLGISSSGGRQTLTFNFTDAGDPGGAFASAMPLTLTAGGDATANDTVSLSDPDYYSFTTASAGTFTLTLTDSAAVSNVRLGLYNSSRTLVASASLSGGTATISNKMIPVGTYYVAVTSSLAASTVYSLDIDGSYFPAASDDNTAATANTTSIGTLLASEDQSRIHGSDITTATASDWVGYGDKVDYYKFIASYAGSFNISISGTAGAYAKLSLYSVSASGSLSLLKSVTMTGSAGSYAAAINGQRLRAGTYCVSIASTDGGAGRANTSYTLSVGGTYFPTANDNNTAATADTTSIGVLLSGSTPTFNGGVSIIAATVSDWVGYGDSADYYKFTASYAGSFNISISGTEGAYAKLNLYSVSGSGSLSLLKSVTMTGSAGNYAAAINGRLLRTGNYCVSIVSADGGAGRANTYYTLSVGGTYFPTANSNNTGATANADAIGTLDVGDGQSATSGSTMATATVSDWVGYGDSVDYYRFTTVNAGSFNISISGTEGSYAKLNLYSVSGSGSLSLLKSVTMTGSAGSYAAAINGRLLRTGTYCVSIVSTDGGAGVANTGYTLSVGGTYFPTANDNNTGATADTSAIGTLVAGEGQSATSGSTMATATVSDWVGYGDSVDYYKFTASDAGLFNISISGTEGAYAKLNLYSVSASGSLSFLRSVTMTGGFGSYTAAISGQRLRAGNYCVSIASTDGGAGVANTGYTLSVGGTYYPTANANNTGATANTSAIGTLVAGDGQSTASGSTIVAASAVDWVGYGDSVDYYKFTASNAGAFNISISGTEGAYAKLNLYSVSGSGSLSLLKSVTMTGGSGSYSALISGQVLRAGNYCVSIASTDGGAGVANTGYTLNVGGSYYPTANANNTGATATELASGSPATDWVGYGDALDYFKFSGAGASTVDLSTVSAGAKLLVCKSVNNGATLTTLATYTLSGAGTLEKTLAQLSSGDYYVGVMALDSGSTNRYNTAYQLSVSSIG